MLAGVRRASRVAALAICGLAVIGCSSADQSNKAPTSTTVSPTTTGPTEPATGATDDDLEAAVRGYSDAFLAGDPDTAYEMFSARCRDRVSSAELSDVVTAGAALYGDAEITSYDAEVSDNFARVTYRFTDSEVEQAEACGWVTRPPNRKGYIPLRCGCGKHMLWLHKTPSDPNYFSNKIRYIQRVCC